MPKALVATMIGTSPPMNRSWLAVAVGGLHPAVVRRDSKPWACEELGQLAHRLDRRRVDDPAAGLLGEQPGQPLPPRDLVGAWNDIQVQVGPIEPGVHDLGVGDAQLPDDVVDHLVGGRRRHGQTVGRPSSSITEPSSR